MRKFLQFVLLVTLFTIGVAACDTLPTDTLVTPMPTSSNLSLPKTPTVVPTPTMLQFNLQPGEVRRATNGSFELEIQYLGVDVTGSSQWTCSTKIENGTIVDCWWRIGESQETVFIVDNLGVVARATEQGSVRFTSSDWKQSPPSVIAP